MSRYWGWRLSQEPFGCRDKRCACRDDKRSDVAIAVAPVAISQSLSSLICHGALGKTAVIATPGSLSRHRDIVMGILGSLSRHRDRHRDTGVVIATPVSLSLFLRQEQYPLGFLSCCSSCRGGRAWGCARRSARPWQRIGRHGRKRWRPSVNVGRPRRLRIERN